MKKYSEIITSKNREFRYDFENALLQYVYIDTEENNKIQIIDEIGLMVDEWLESSDFWIDTYHEHLNLELQALGF